LADADGQHAGDEGGDLTRFFVGAAADVVRVDGETLGVLFAAVGRHAAGAAVVLLGFTGHDRSGDGALVVVEAMDVFAPRTAGPARAPGPAARGAGGAA